jgi:hypothetical protein
LFFSTAVTVMLLCGLEGMARLKAHLFPATTGYPSYSGQIWQQRYVELNELGFRDRLEPPSAGPTLLLIGDSFAFGAGLKREEERLGEQIAAGLSEATGVEWNERNGSRGDTHTRHHLEFIDSLRGTNPDLVILEYIFNDIGYLWDTTYRGGPVEAPETILDRIHPSRVAFLNSYLYQELYARARQIAYALAEAESTPDPYADEETVRTHVDDLVAFGELVAETGAALRIVPYELSVAFSQTAAERYERFVQELERRGLAVCSLRHAFDGTDLDDLVVSSLDAHANAYANELAADHLLPCLLEAISG